jgi:hypothetical protein
MAKTAYMAGTVAQALLVPANILAPTTCVVEQQFALFVPLAHALLALLPAIVPFAWHQWNERLFDHTSLTLDASHTIGLQRPPHQLA